MLGCVELANVASPGISSTQYYPNEDGIDCFSATSTQSLSFAIYANEYTRLRIIIQATNDYCSNNTFFNITETCVNSDNVRVPELIVENKIVSFGIIIPNTSYCRYRLKVDVENLGGTLSNSIYCVMACKK